MAATKSSRKAKGKSKNTLSEKKYTRPRVLILGTAGARQIRAAGGDPVTINPGDRSAEAAAHKNVHAMLLLGGSDIDPAIYGARPHKSTQRPDRRRDAAELASLEAAMKRGIPVMGICRGAQIINAACGGTLHQNVPDLPRASNFHCYGRHGVVAAKGSRLREAFGGKEREVRSLHHQAVDRVAPGFVATGWARDGVVECVESVEGWVVAVQFHPEMMNTQSMQNLFNGLVAAAAEKFGMPAPTPEKVTPEPRRRPQGAYQKREIVVARSIEEAVREDEFDGFEINGQSDDDLLTAMLLDDEREQKKQTRRGVTTYWRCFSCRIDFEERDDHADHMLHFHDVEVRQRVRR